MSEPRAPLGADPVLLRHRELERIANTTLRLGRMLMESGADVRTVHYWCQRIATGLGAESTGLRSGYASLETTVGSHENTITRMVPVGRHGMNARLLKGLQELAQAIGRGGWTPDQVEQALSALVKRTPRYPTWSVAIAVGLACAAFAQILGADSHALGPIMIASSIAQGLRHWLLHREANFFVVTAVTAWLAATLSGLLSRWLGSHSLALAMIASTLMLVPGVPATNAQTDIMEGFPTVGSARVVWVMMTMIFATTGIWIAQAVLGVSP